MTAYVISQVKVRSGKAVDDYRRLAAASIERHGGKYLVRGGETTILEGQWDGGTIVVEFASIEQAKARYESEDYAEALKFRDDALSRNLILVDGVA